MGNSYCKKDYSEGCSRNYLNNATKMKKNVARRSFYCWVSKIMELQTFMLFYKNGKTPYSWCFFSVKELT